MRIKFLLILTFSICSYSASYSQDAWEMINASFQEYFAQEKFESALKMAEKEYEYANNNDAPIYQLAFSCSDLGLTYYALKRFKEAEKFLTMAVEHNITMSGKDSDNTLAEINQLALNYAAMENYGKADSLLRDIVEVRVKQHGRDSEEVKDAAHPLIQMHDALGDIVEVSKIRALYNIPEPNCDCPGEEKAKQDSIKSLEELITEPTASNDSTIVETATKNKTMKAESANPGVTHSVKKGETLYSISVKYKVTVKELKEWNKLKTNFLKVGQKLKVKKY
ncbi:MAG: LysM peptidoglycan-binding domain-containing protein [Bacteroidia bacterium]|nr:LysM peptidoglycan-binding domain-containing protein [Bacteroidia bacterium]NNC84635.1 LysM peptidoglycan-binding domain-containing protein [Bacteroidia bacterium]NNM15116.1 LysM peptidoglycan-binding domain-containing protein [Bacteroidia bacterium]